MRRLIFALVTFLALAVFIGFVFDGGIEEVTPKEGEDTTPSYFEGMAIMQDSMSRTWKNDSIEYEHFSTNNKN